jgi:hypothetical protein
MTSARAARRFLVLLVLLLLGVVPARAEAPARAETPVAGFEDLVRDAVPLDRAGLRTLLWAISGSCPRSGSDLWRRQCEAVKAKRAAWARERTFVMRDDGVAVSAGAFDLIKAGLPLTVRGCLACRTPIEGYGYVVTRGAVAAAGSSAAVQAPELVRTLRPFASETAAARWKATALPRLRVEIVFRLPRHPTGWRAGKLAGWYVEPLGYRVSDPCDGSVVTARPPATGGPPVDDAEASSTCAGETVARGGKPADVPVAAVRRVFEGTRPAVHGCFERFGVAGVADLYVVIARDGGVRSVEVRGSLAGSPTAACIRAAVSQAHFPAFRERETITIHSQFTLKAD